MENNNIIINTNSNKATLAPSTTTTPTPTATTTPTTTTPTPTPTATTKQHLIRCLFTLGGFSSAPNSAQNGAQNSARWFGPKWSPRLQLEEEAPRCLVLAAEDSEVHRYEFLGWKPLERPHNPGKLDLNQVSPKTGFYSLMLYFFVLEYIHDKLFGC